MPKKTKKQKLLAQLHRKIETVSKNPSANFVKSQNISATIISSSPSTSTFAYNENAVRKPKTQDIIADHAQVKHDLIRITIFVIFAATFQSVLYFFLQRR